MSSVIYKYVWENDSYNIGKKNPDVCVNSTLSDPPFISEIGLPFISCLYEMTELLNV